MSNKKQDSLESLGHAVNRLREALQLAPDSSRIAIDATIQRFEFTFELLWKTLRLFLIDTGIETNSPRAAFEEAYKQKWIDDEQIWLQMMKSRNLTSHTYDEHTADQIYANIHEFNEPIKSLYERLKAM